MSVDQTHILYSLAKTFDTVLNVNICDDTKIYIKSNSKSFNKLDVDEKLYYTKYAMEVAQCLSEYLEKLSNFELNTDNDHDIIHDFRLSWGKKNIAHVCLSHIGINIRDIIPEKLMKICKYKRNTNICKAYNAAYSALNDKGYKKIEHKSKYSEISAKTKNSIILEPMCNLVLNTISKKRKCSVNLYDHLFGESDRIVFKLHKNRFVMYDFGKELVDVESFKMKLKPENTIEVAFNNGMKFNLCLHTNATEIKN